MKPPVPTAVSLRELFRFPSRLERRIAVRYLRSRRGRRGASLGTTISIGGVAVGIMALIVVLGVMNGLRNELLERILVASPHLRVLTYGDNLRIDDWGGALETIRSTPGVVAAAPEVTTQSLILNAASYPEGVFVIGLDTAAVSLPVNSIPEAITEGDLSFQASDTAVDGALIIGRRLAQRLSAFPGDVVGLISPTAARVNPALGYAMPRIWKFQVTGIFETGMYQYDNQFVLMDREMAQRFAGLDTAITGIQVRVGDPWEAPRIGRELEDRLGFPYRSMDWQTQNHGMFAALQLEKLGMGLVIFFVMIVAAFNIVGDAHHAGDGQDPRNRHSPGDGAAGRLHRADLPGAGCHHRGDRRGDGTGGGAGRWLRRRSERVGPHRSLRLLHRPAAGAHRAVRRGRRHRGRPLRRDRGHALPLARRDPAHAGGRDPTRMNVVLEARGLRKSYLGGDGTLIDVLSGVDLLVSQGEFVAVMGASGAGKSTLLHLLGALDAPTAGEVLLDGERYADRSAGELAALRNARIGFVFQFHHSAAGVHREGERDAAAADCGGGRCRRRARAPMRCSRRSGSRGGGCTCPPSSPAASSSAWRWPAPWSNGPAVVLADEPSGNLDHAHSENLHRIFAGLARDFQTALVVVTHNRHLAERADRLLMMEAGLLVPAAREAMPS